MLKEIELIENQNKENLAGNYQGNVCACSGWDLNWHFKVTQSSFANPPIMVFQELLFRYIFSADVVLSLLPSLTLVMK